MISTPLYDIDTDDYEYQQELAEGGVFGFDPEDYDPTPLDQAYEEGDETKELFVSFWFSASVEEVPIDPVRYRGTRLDWYTLEEYRSLNPKGGG